MNKQPEITEKTKQKFVDAFWELIQEKPISKIAVSELTKRAGYNRSTFYEYFLDTDDLLAYVEEKLIEEVKQKIQETLSDEQLPKPATITDLFPIVFTTMSEKIYWLIGPNGDPSFSSRIRAELIPLVAHRIPIPTDMQNFDYLVSFVNSAAFGLMQHWHEQNKNISIDEIRSMLQNLAFHGLSAYIDIEPNN